MTTLRSFNVRRAGHSGGAQETISLDYEARFLRRKRLVSDQGRVFFVDLPETLSLHDGDAFEMSDGSLVSVRAAAEPLTEVRAASLPRLAWHIGNRHTPCQIEEDHLLIRRDHVLSDMLRRLGADLREVERPFTPEGGAYGHGRTVGHAHDHGEGHAHQP